MASAGDARKWLWRDAKTLIEDKVYRSLRNRNLGYCLDVQGAKGTVGTPLWSWRCTDVETDAETEQKATRFISAILPR